MERYKKAARRDGLGQFCFWLHVLILAFVVAGWMLPGHAVLIFYLAFLPLMVAHWKLNQGACALNNLENWLRYRRWRAPERNPEEGAWLRSMIARLSGVALSRQAMDLVIYAAMALFWGLAWAHFLLF